MKHEISTDAATELIMLEAQINKVYLITDAMFVNFASGLINKAAEDPDKRDEMTDFTQTAKETLSFMETLLKETDVARDKCKKSIDELRKSMRSWGVWTEDLHNEKGTSTPESESTFNSNTN